MTAYPSGRSGAACRMFWTSLAGLVLALGWASARAGELTALAWDETAAEPTLALSLTGSPGYEVQSFEDGRRLRLVLPDTVLAGASDLGERGVVKGVYPYPAETGNAVNVDVLLTRPGQLRVAPSPGGLRVTAVTGAAPAPAAPAAASNSIEEIVYAKLPGNRIQIQVRMSGTPPRPAVFTTSNPARIALDFPGTDVKAALTTVKVGEGAVQSVNAVPGRNRARVVVNLVRAAGYTTAADARSFTITVDNPASGIAGTQAPKTTRFATAPRPGKHGLKSIDFRRGPQGDGKIVVGLSDSGVGIDIREQAGEIIVDFLDTGIPAELQRRLDVIDFGTPVHNIDTFVQGKNVRMVILAKGRYEHLAYQAGDVFTVNVKPIVTKPDEVKKDEFGYSGEKLSLNFQNIDVRAALQVIADFTGLNFVTSDSVKGNLTLRLKDVPWDQALEIIADAKSLAIRRSGNVVRVGPADEVAAKEKAALEAGKAVLDLEPLISELIQINYAKAEELAKLLKSIKAVDAGAQASPFGTVAKLETESNSLLSPRGQVTVDQRTNALLVQDTPTKIKEIRKLIAQLDQPVRQVMIETRLVEATSDFAKTLGTRWGGLKQPTKVDKDLFACGTQGCLVSVINDDDILVEDFLGVNLGADPIRGVNPAAITGAVWRLTNASLLSLELSALESEGRGRIISSPRLITSNQKKARIEQGQEGLFRALSAGLGTTSFVIRKAVLALEVTPQITPDNRIIMDVLITKDVFRDATNGLIDKKEITTQVLLDNGETIVIGGVYEEESGDRVTKVPFFGDLPLVGWAFRKKSVVDDKRELLIFLTPRIMSETLSLK